MVSCIITTYNRPVSILKRAIDSVLNQTYKDIEVIIVNDCPENKKLAKEIQYLIRLYSETITILIEYVELERNSGACIARNTGINIAHGDYVAFLDDDDEWKCQKLEKMVACMEADNSIGLVYSQYIIKSSDKESVIIPKYYSSNWRTQILGHNYIGSTSFPLLRKSVLLSAGAFDPKMPSMQDWDVWIRMAKYASFGYLNLPLTIYHVESESITTNIAKKKDGYDRIITKYSEDYKNHYRQKSSCLVWAGYDLYKHGAIKEGKQYIIKGILTYPFQISHLKIVKGILKIRYNKRSKGDR